MSRAHFSWSETASTLRPMTLVLRLSNSGLIFAMYPSSVVQTGVKSFGCEKRMAQEFPIHSWKLIGPSVVWAVKFGASSPIRMEMASWKVRRGKVTPSRLRRHPREGLPGVRFTGPASAGYQRRDDHREDQTGHRESADAEEELAACAGGVRARIEGASLVHRRSPSPSSLGCRTLRRAPDPTGHRSVPTGRRALGRLLPFRAAKRIAPAQGATHGHPKGCRLQEVPQREELLPLHLGHGGGGARRCDGARRLQPRPQEHAGAPQAAAGDARGRKTRDRSARRSAVSQRRSGGDIPQLHDARGEALRLEQPQRQLGDPAREQWPPVAEQERDDI